MAIKPQIFWSMDNRASVLVERFVDNIRDQIGPEALYSVLKTTDEVDIQAFQNEIIAMRESATAKNITEEPRVILFTSAFTTDSEIRLDLLDVAADTLDTILPGAGSIALVIFLPPATSTEPEKQQTFSFFLELERKIGAIPYLDIAFVYELAPDFFNNQTDSDNNGQILFELLFRQLFDTDLDGIPERLGFAAIRNQNQAHGRKYCYSTLRFFRFIFHSTECIEHLKTRIQQEIFNICLMPDTDSFGAETLKLIQNKCDIFVNDLLKRTKGQLPVSAKILAAVSGQGFGSDPLKKGISIIQKDSAETIKEVGQQQLDQIESFLEVSIRQELIDFLKESPEFLAGATLYMKALRGQRLYPTRQTDRESPTGAVLFEKSICRDELLKAVQKSTGHALDRLNISVDPSLQKASGLEWLQKTAQLIEQNFEHFSDASLFPVQFLYSSIECILIHLQTEFIHSDEAIQLAKDIVAIFEDKSQQLLGAVEYQIQTKEELEKNSANLNTEYGIFSKHFTRRNEYNDKKTAFAEKIQDSEKNIELLNELWEALQQEFVYLMNHAIFPNISGAQTSQIFREKINEVSSELSGFISDIKFTLAEKVAGSIVPEYTKPTTATVLDQSKLNALYATLFKGRTISELTRDLFKFYPSNLSGYEVENLSYYNCHTLKEHYQTGYESLLDRMEHFAVELSLPLRELNILDVIEIEGKDPGMEYLRNRMDANRKIFDFSSGYVPLVEQIGHMNSIPVVKTADEINKRLAADYSHLFSPETHFIANQTSNTIDITWLIFGFPAFLIHILAECRKKYGVEKDASDLWPVAS